MVGQDQETFHQARRQHRNDGKGNVGDQLAKPPANCGQAKKGDHGCKRRGKDRHRHAPGGVFGGDHWRFAQATGAEICVFAHHDGVIHHDPQRDNQAKERDHVDRQPADIHQRNGCKHGRRDASGYPECNAGVEEQKQQDHHQPEAHQPVVDQNIEPPGDCLCAGANK